MSISSSVLVGLTPNISRGEAALEEEAVQEEKVLNLFVLEEEAVQEEKVLNLFVLFSRTVVRSSAFNMVCECV